MTKGSISNVCYAIGNRDGGQTTAKIKRIVADSGYIVGNPGILASTDKHVLRSPDEGITAIARVVGRIAWWHLDGRQAAATRVFATCCVSADL